MSDLSFDNPSGWGWMALVVVCGLLAMRCIVLARANLRRFVDAPLIPSILPPGTFTRRIAKSLLCLCVLVGLVLAWVGPRWGGYLERVQQRPIDITVCLDVSRSMSAEDAGMSRLDRAKDDTRRLLKRINGGSVALVAFAGRGSVLCPLTDDYDYVRMVLDEAGTHSAQAGGTDIGRAIVAALKLFDDQPDRRRAIFLLTDGEDHNDSAVAFARQAAERDIRVFAFGYGDSRQGARIPVDGPQGRAFLSHDGEQVWSRMNPEALSAVTAAGGGEFVESAWGGDVRAIERTYEREFATIEGRPIQDSRALRKHARYQWPAAFALLLLAIETMLPERRRAGRRLTEWRLSARRAACIAALTALPLCEGDARAQWLREPAASYVDEGNKLLEDREPDAALAAYLKAETRAPGMPEIAFDKGIAFYRRGDLDLAAAASQDALTTRDRLLEANATYNLARCTHESAIRGEKNTEAAMMKLAKAIGFYEDALRLAPDHPHAAGNLDLAKRLMRFFEARLADERKREQQKARQGSQPQQGGSSDDSQQQSSDDQQPSDKADPGESKSPQDGEPSPSENAQSDGEKGDSGKEGKPSEGSGEQTPKPSDRQRDPQFKPTAIPIEEAEAMLQDARDAELRRRAVLRERAMRQQEQAKPERDW